MRGGMSGGLLEYTFDVPNPFNIFQSADLGISGAQAQPSAYSSIGLSQGLDGYINEAERLPLSPMSPKPVIYPRSASSCTRMLARRVWRENASLNCATHHVHRGVELIDTSFELRENVQDHVHGANLADVPREAENVICQWPHDVL